MFECNHECVLLSEMSFHRSCSCVVQWLMFYFILGMKGAIEMTVHCWMTRKNELVYVYVSDFQRNTMADKFCVADDVLLRAARFTPTTTGYSHFQIHIHSQVSQEVYHCC
jgi:hypothetical protein